MACAWADGRLTAWLSTQNAQMGRGMLAGGLGIDQETILRFADHYLGVQAKLGGAGALRTIDKMPQNFLHLGMIAVLFPRARIVHCRRDPMDSCVSAYVQNFLRVAFTTSLEDLGFYYRQYERLMAHWRRVLPVPAVR